MKLFKKSDDEERESLVDELLQKVAAANMPAHVLKIAEEEVGLLGKINPSAAEYTIGITYIDYLLTLPWNKRTADNLDLTRAETILNEDHYGLTKTKERLLEHLAVKVLRSSRRPRVLVADDEEVARKNLAYILEKEGYAVSTAANGSQVLDALNAAEYDVVITDLRMGGVDGMEVLSRVRTDHPGTKVIMVTGYATVPSAIEAMKKGALSYIAKPFKLDEVRVAVKEAVESRSQIGNTKGSVLCFAGPPGTGKTSLGRSIARALGRKFMRISLGGMKDEAEIRGHRRTYIGAMPGRIIQVLKRAEARDPVIMLDEVDKVGADWRGDPSSALLEVLDPEQNKDFRDNYLDVPFDLSKVMFITTANQLGTIPPPLLDRMEVIQLPGYTEFEKLNIAKKYLVPKETQANALKDNELVLQDDAITGIIKDYTREAGVRNLEREIANVCRKVAKAVAESKPVPITVTAENLHDYLGKPKFFAEVAGMIDRPGVVTGLAWTPSGGDILFVEATTMPGNKQLILTGQLGDVMKESAQAALSYVRSKAEELGISKDFYEKSDIHIHVPAGAIPKDGPSAGVTMTTALVSLLTGKVAKYDMAMTGEVTLRGKVMPIGGVKEKVLAARRAGIKTVILPDKNKNDLEDVPEELRKEMTFVFAETIDQVIKAALDDSKKAE
ncbi:MAG TPA: endopeptidase La [Nitrospiraceae bacterium]|nr:endopeptidase La [Nitrospiraceae bacterium]